MPAVAGDLAKAIDALRVKVAAGDPVDVEELRRVLTLGACDLMKSRRPMARARALQLLADHAVPHPQHEEEPEPDPEPEEPLEVQVRRTAESFGLSDADTDRLVNGARDHPND